MHAFDESTPVTNAAALDRKTLFALVEASRLISRGLDPNEVFDQVADQAARVLEAEGSSVLLYDEPRGELVFQATHGPAAALIKGERLKADQGIAGQVVRTGRAVRVDNVRQNANFFPGIDAKTRTQTVGLLAAPLIDRGKVLGVVEVINAKGRDNFSDADLDLLRIFANLAAAATRNAQDYDRVSKENRGLRESIKSPAIVGESEAIKKVLKLCEKVARSRASVMVTGETGAGKELVARNVHDLSERRDKPFIALNCAALPETLLESELFGHEKGAFTGAVERKLGRFELADGGTLFLDELGEMSMSTQVKLLRVLQDQQFVRVGGTQTLICDVRIVAATNKDLSREIEAGRFRSDLYYRLNVFPIHIPPLRERVEDLPLLVTHFIRQIVPSLGVPAPRISDAAMMCLMRYHWPGNIRELRNVIERSTLLAGPEITIDHLPPEVAARGAGLVAAQQTNAPALPADTGATSKLADHERALILQALAESQWNQSEAARKLGITRDLLRYRMKKYGFKKP